MASGAESGGTFKAIVVAVVIALATGGSAPFWWQYLFPPKPAQQPYTQTTIPPGTNNNALGACHSGLSPSNQFHDVSAPGNDWDWNCDGQVTREYQSCENMTRAQCDPNTNVTGKLPGYCDEKRGPMGCPQRVGVCGGSGYLYPCFFTPSDGRCHAGGYETAVVLRCK